MSEIIISNVQRKDDGLYECQARNKGGQFFKSGHIQVNNTIYFPPFFASNNPNAIFTLLTES